MFPLFEIFYTALKPIWKKGEIEFAAHILEG
jgi:hypothetical protein